MRRTVLATLWLGVAGWMLPAVAVAQTSDSVRVSGVVLDSNNAQPLPGVTVAAAGTSAAQATDLDGRYALMLSPGAHRLTFSLDGYQARSVEIDLSNRRQLEITTTLALGGFTEVVNVTGDVVDADTSTETAQLVERRRATVISDNLGGQEMRRNADSNAAAALQRVTGLSVVDNQHVFVRGLGERYSHTTLNGASVPSTQPERRVVSLDLFPAGLLDSVSIVKSYTPDRPAEFAGGLVEIVPARLPNRSTFNVGYEWGGNSATLGEPVFDYAGGRTDWLARDDGRRALPAMVPARRVIRGGIFTPDVGFSREDLQRFGEAFENLWDPAARDGRGNNQWSAVYGNRWGRVGALASLYQSQKPQYRDEVQRYFRVESGEGLTTFSDYAYRAYEVKSSLAGVLNVGYQLNPNNRVGFQGFSTNSGSRETRQFEGFNADAARVLRNTRLMWVEENLTNGQVTGEHLFTSLSHSRLEWRASVGRSNRDEPDLRETLYEETGGRFLLADESQSGYRMFNDLDETSYDLGASWSFPVTKWNGLPMSVKVGPQYSRRERDFASRRFRFVPLDVIGLDLSQSPQALFAPENIGSRFELREETRATDFYNAEQEVASVYGMADVALSAAWRVIGGARLERFTQRVDTFDLFDADFDDDPDVIRAENRATDVFPAVNLVYAVRQDQNVRFGVSQTVNRPEFRELAPFEFTDIVGGRAVVGNPGLTQSRIQNYDVRWEWFPRAEEVVAASFFYKRFGDPIERFVEPTAQLRTSFQNADSARNAGVEIEARKRIAPALLVGGNYTFVDSSISLTASQTNVLTTLERPLAGTSKNLFNGYVEGRTGGFSARLLVNVFDDRIVDVGSLGLPDIFEAGRTTLDLVAQQRLGPVTLRIAADNLTDSPVEYLQGDQVQRSFKYGRTVSFQFGFSAF